MFKKYKKKILISVIIGAVVYIIFSIYADFDNLLFSFSKFNWWWYPVLLVLSFINYIIRFFKWLYYTKILDIDISIIKSFLIFLSAFTMSVSPGKMGEVLKSFLLKEENGTPVSKSAPIVFAERLTDFISITILCIAGAFMFDYGKSFILIVGIIFILITIMLGYRSLMLKILSVLEKIKFINKHIQKFHTAYESVYSLIKIKPLIFATLISIISWFFECIGFYIILYVFTDVTNINISLLTATFVYAFSTLVGAIVMLPGGIGATEASITGLLILLKIPKDVSVASTIIIRTATLWFSVLVGIISLIVYQYISHKSIKNIQIDLDNKIT